HHREPIGVDRALRLLGHEVIHHAEEAGSEEKPDRVVAVPPFHHRVDDTGVDAVRLGQAYRDREIVEYVQYGDGDDECRIEPIGDVDVLHPALCNGGEEHHRVGDPDDGDQNIDRPFQLRVFLALRDPE